MFYLLAASDSTSDDLGDKPVQFSSEWLVSRVRLLMSVLTVWYRCFTWLLLWLMFMIGSGQNHHHHACDERNSRRLNCSRGDGRRLGLR
jgi:hypothetical protein